MKEKAVFITGTDTNVGKTFVIEALYRALELQGKSVGIMKPISCGPRKEEDAFYLKKELGLTDPIDLINPIHLPLPLSPFAAKKATLHEINLAEIKSAFEQLKDRHQLLLVEGVGGVMVPLRMNYFVDDLIRFLDLPTIVVARAGLGTLNHTLLTLERLRRKRVKVLGVILNQAKGDLAEKDNPEIIEKMGKTKILATIPDKARNPEQYLADLAGTLC
jgi:dethiobiotin synthetase